MDRTKRSITVDKSGWKTTEFWMNLAAVIVAYLMATGIAGDETSLFSRALVAVAAALAALGYTASRAVVKRESIRKG